MLLLRLPHQASILVDRTRHWHRVNRKTLGDSDVMTRSVPVLSVARLPNNATQIDRGRRQNLDTCKEKHEQTRKEMEKVWPFRGLTEEVAPIEIFRGAVWES